ncbi:MAG TPA: helix-turn-helix domain-containing protein, partial [Pseudonocardia sp.]|nr:helix-turn-helix domain-containing protein [Pseudonocardia sp.]
MSTLQTLDRGLSVLELVSQRPAGVSVAELAAALDVHRAICYRIVATLEA